AALADRTLDQDPGVEQIGVDVAVVAVASTLARLDVDDAADRVAEPTVEVAGDEVDLREDVRVEHRGDRPEVKQLGDLVIAEVGLGVARRRAADHDQAGAERRAGDAGEVLDALERVALGAGQQVDLLAGDGSAGDLGELALDLDDRAVGVALESAVEVVELEDRVGLELLDVVEALVGGRQHDDAHAPGRD